MNALQVSQIINLGLGAFLQFGVAKQKPAKADIKAYILASTQVTESIGHLKIKDLKKFDKGINQMVDSVDLLLTSAEWK